MTPPPDGRPAPAEVERRIGIVRDLLVDRGAASALLRTRRSFAWLTVGSMSHVVHSSERGAAAVVVDRTSARVLAPVNEADRLRDEELDGLPLDIERHPWDAEPAPPEGSVLTDDDLEADLAPRRAVLGGLERARLRWLGGRLSELLDEATMAAEPGRTELAVAGELLGRLAAEDIRAPVLLVAADERITRYRHPLPSANRISARVMLVAVAERWGLHAALTRFREIEPPSAEIQARRAAVEAVHTAMLAATRPGATLGAVVAAAQRAYAGAGFPDEWQLHHQGGLLGYQPRERIAVPGDETVLRPGMAVAWNPSITGAKVEASHLLTDDVADPLQRLTYPEPIPSHPTPA